MDALEGDRGGIPGPAELLDRAYAPTDVAKGDATSSRPDAGDDTVARGKELLARVEEIVEAKDVSALFEESLLRGAARLRNEQPEAYAAIKAIVRASRAFSIRDFEAAVRRHTPPPPRAAGGGHPGYQVREGRLVRIVGGGEGGEQCQPLCDFTARIVEE